jgi:dUTP pyrophosphatase
MQVKFKRLSEKAVQPIRATEGSAGYDLTSTHVTTEVSECGQLILVYHTDLTIELPEGYAAYMFPRSSISKKSLRLCNSVGVIDSDYRGEIMGKFIVTTDVIPSLYREGERFAQLVIMPIATAEFIEAEELSETNRGEEGFGSTDEQSAPNAPAGSPEDKSELINQEEATTGSGGEENIPEQAE